MIFAPASDGCLVIGIELKADRGRLSDGQAVTHADMMIAGVRCRLARSVDHVQDILIANQIPVHARVSGGFYGQAA
jgi:hypothetical protein